MRLSPFAASLIMLPVVFPGVALAAPSERAAGAPLAELGAGFSAYRAGAHAGAARTLGGVVNKGLAVNDWALFLLGESLFFEGDFAGARARFEQVAKAAGRGAASGRPAQMAPWRVADCLW